MKKVLIITRTNWSEPPRIRHQLTRLLLQHGYAITYVEKNAYKNALVRTRTEEGITFYAHAELLHHQLRYFRVLQEANNFVVKQYLKKILKRVEFDFILNFCYEYSFLKQLAPGKKVITMIEDDFESQAKFGMENAIRNQVRRTCQNSHHVLTVSYPLLEKLKTYTPDVRLLFPWSANSYRRPGGNKERNTVLYFGYIHRMDWPMVENLLRDTPYHYRFVGPISKTRSEHVVQHLRQRYSNFEYVAYSSIDTLKIDDVFCSILPYDPVIRSVQACTVSNRAFNLLSLGLPLVYADLRSLIKAPETVIRRNATIEDYKESLSFFRENFFEVQPDIEKFLSNHYAEDRWRVLEEVINEPITTTQSN